MAERDGEFVCGFCKTALNSSDLNCWRCGSVDLKDMRPVVDTDACTKAVMSPAEMMAKALSEVAVDVAPGQTIMFGPYWIECAQDSIRIFV